ncbi:hypothetical protein ABBQ38_002373 [Trebouxia sp. C0009 RCD-2024]
MSTEGDRGAAIAGSSSELPLLLGPDQEDSYADVEWLEAFAATDDVSMPRLLYVDAVLPETTVESLAKAGVQHIVYWSEGKPGSQLVAVHFGHVFAAMLRNPATSIPEAYAIACHACHVHLGTKLGQAEGPQAAALPCFLSAQSPRLPLSNSIPLPQVEGMDLSQGVGAAVPDWDDVRLLAPHAELRLLACGQASLIQPHRLSYLGETLRAVLVLEVQQLTVLSQKPTQRIPAHLPSGCTAICCQIQTAGKAQAQVVLGGPHAGLKTAADSLSLHSKLLTFATRLQAVVAVAPPSWMRPTRSSATLSAAVLQKPALVEHALRQTLAADALSLQLKLPPAGVPLPMAQTSPDLAGGTAVVDIVAVTSVWVVQVLRALCMDSSSRMLATLGVAAVGCTASSAFTEGDAHRFTALSHLTPAVPESLDPVLPAPPGPTPLGPISHNTLSAQQQSPGAPLHMERQRSGSLAGPTTSAASRGRPAKEPKLSAPETAAISWSSGRPDLAECSPRQLLEDMRLFLQVRRGKQLQADTFPEAILNGAQLDLNALYRAVCGRGGFATGIGVNWAGQVFPRMANYTNTHKMTGVGNALKRHYQALCLDYELAHPDDPTKQEASVSG